MAKFKKQTLPATTTGKPNSAKTLADPVERKKFKTSLAAITQHFQLIDDQKEAIKEIIEELNDSTGIEKKTIRKLAVTMFKHNYTTLQEENEHFSDLYETVIEGRLLNAPDPLDTEDEDDGAEE